jgi:SAM-dependent methyltransferase/membrane protease YdiL (CAAX protease family)
MQQNKQGRQKLFAWNPQRITVKAGIVALAVIGLSAAMIPLPTGSIAAIVIRDILMILALGFAWPITCMKADGDLHQFGLTARRWPLALAVNITLAVLLSIVFARHSPPPEHYSPVEHAGEIAYIMLAGIFETVFFYAFVREAFARSFGAVAGIIVAAACYSLHHVGFQPEFAKLFFVGLLYAIPVAVSGNALTIYPFFWGIGATWDVLVQSEKVKAIAFPWERAALLAAGMVAILLIARKMKTPGRVIEGGAIEDGESLSCEDYGTRMREHLADEYRRFARQADQTLRPPKDARVLEIGPGPGWAGIELLRLRPDIRLTGLDASSDMVRAARKNAETEGVADRAEYIEGVAEDLSRFGQGTFDAIISRDSLHHWIDPAKAFRGFACALKPEGGVYLSDERRNLGTIERFFVRSIASRLGQDMARGWENSIGAAWTPAEAREFFPAGEASRWRAEPEFLDLKIVRKPRRQFKKSR